MATGLSFELYTAPTIVFGNGVVERLREIVPRLGRRALLVVGKRSADDSGLRARLERLLPVGALVRCRREPTVEDVDRAVEGAREGGCDTVVAAGGGAVLDCGKAAAGMLTNGGSLREYLEGVGGRTIERPPLPMVAVPTTAGTGSEVTKNAVISGVGYKKSVRSPLLIPRVALVDPQLTYTLPDGLTAATGMDALTQLIEAYLSRNATPLTDGLALQGIEAGGRSLEQACASPADPTAREGMALASLLGGICLANAGLGAVHGLASPLGALFPISHGVACAALLPQVLRANIRAAEGTPVEARVLQRAARLSEALTGRRFVDQTSAIDAGLTQLQQLQHALAIPRLGELGVELARLGEIVQDARTASSMRYNPVDLTAAQLEEVLRRAL
jgi:alcohol dehydrogenase class IV